MNVPRCIYDKLEMVADGVSGDAASGRGRVIRSKGRVADGMQRRPFIHGAVQMNVWVMVSRMRW